MPEFLIECIDSFECHITDDASNAVNTSRHLKKGEDYFFKGVYQVNNHTVVVREVESLRHRIEQTNGTEFFDNRSFQVESDFTEGSLTLVIIG